MTHPISAAALQPARDLYEQGLILQAYRATETLGPLTAWHGTDAQVFAGRLAAHLGAMGSACWLMRRAWRGNPQHAEACYFYAYTLFRLRGPYPTWCWMQRRLELPAAADAETRSSWLALLGEIVGTLRDFETAERWLQDAEAAAPDSVWVLACRSHVLEIEDRYDEALAIARRALEVRPWYRPAVQRVAYLLTLMDRDAESLELLTTAAARIESNAVVGQLFALQIELHQYEAARRSLERFQELSPLAEKPVRQWLAAQRSEIAYRLGDDADAIRWAQESDSDFHKAVAERLQTPGRAQGRTVLLPVGFVRQHQVTCAPATLSAISRFWSMPAEHLQVAEEICYNGTTNYSERKWAHDHGWTAREFTVTEAAANALLDRGIPFTFVTVEPGGGHLQAVIGYDARRGTLTIRDPYWRNAGEALTDKLLERYRAFGPRGMALVPTAKSELLAGIDLPDAAEWDRLHALDGALIGHRREEAQRVFEQMRADMPEHLLTREARRRLALYDCNPTEHLAAVEQLLEINPEDQSLLRERLNCLGDLSRRDERLTIYRQLCQKKETHPIFWQQYAEELRVDARRHDDAIWLLRRAIRRWPSEAANYFILANIYSDQHRFDEALELYRFATCLGEKDEQYAQAYFSAAAWLKQTDVTLALLRDRFARFGSKSSQPAHTLFSAYLQLSRTTEALQVLEDAMALRPDDGQLLLFAADGYMACSFENMPRATALLQQARDKSPPGAWLRTAARLAASDGRLEDARGHWQQVLQIQPLAIDAHRAVARLLAETQGPAAARQHLEQASERFPHHHPLHELWIEWMRDETREVREPVIRRVLELNPDDAFVRRELALVLADERKFDEAWQHLEAARQLDPQSPSFFMVSAYLRRCQDQIDEAKAALRQAIELSVDNDMAIADLTDLCNTRPERRAVLAFVQQQLVRQVIFGDGLLAFRRHARGTLEPDELLATLREALQVRLDLWHAWSAVIAQLVDTDQIDDAWELACQATDRFPLTPQLWLDRAHVARLRGDDDGELSALETVYQIAPGWSYAVRELCERHERRGDSARSRQLLEQAVTRDPLDAANHVMLAELLWRQGEREAAVERVLRIAKQEPGFEAAWGNLNQWNDELGCPEKTLEAVRDLTVRRAGEARSWLMLSKVLDAPEQLDERLAALDRAIALNPRCAEAYDIKAASLARAGRWEEALAACRPAPWPDQPPRELRARRAWIAAVRGNRAEAIAEMRAVVADEPQFYDAWSQLAEWYQDQQDKAGFLEAAEAMARISPQYELSLGCLGEARMQNGDVPGAREAFAKAFELNPTYEFAGFNLFDRQLEDGQLDEAAATLAVLKRHADSPLVSAREVRWNAQRNDWDAASAGLRQLCVTASESSWPVAASVEAFVKAERGDAALRILSEQLDAPDAHAEVGVQWVTQNLARHNWKPVRDRLPGLAARGEIGRQATYAFVDGIVQRRRRGELRRFIRNEQAWLREQTFTWGTICFGLAALQEYRRCAKWAADWRERQDALPWMLVNVVEALRAVNRDAEAAKVSRQSLEQPPAFGQHLHHIWLAADEACRGEIAGALEHYEQAAGETLDTDYQFLHELVQAVIDLAVAAPAEQPAVFRAVRRRVSRLRATYRRFSVEPARRRVFRRCVARLAALRGGLFARLWQFRQWLGS